MNDAATLGISDLVRRAAAAAPSHLALVDGPRRLTYAELDREVTRAALALAAAGAAAGDRVVLQLGTTADFVTLYLGALRAGLVAVPLNPSYSGSEVERIVHDCTPKVVVTAESVRGLLAAPPDGADPRADRSGDAIAVLLYTSGTSGHPKGAMLSSRALLANLDQITAVSPPLLSDADVVFVPLPLSHVFGLNAGLGIGLHVGATIVLADRFDAAATLAAMEAEHVTAVVAVPGQYGAWLQQPTVASAFASVRFAMSGASGLPSGIAEAFGALGIVVHDGYGLTEAAPVVALDVLGSGAKPGSVGRPLPGIEVQLRDIDGEPLDEDDDDPGRVFVRGANLFSGYWPDGAGGPGEDGWFGTGDIAVRDADGDLHLVGRTSDMVIVNGFNVYPAEVEAVLAAQPGVAEVAVVGVADEQTGEAVRAFVVPEPGVTLDPQALLAAASRSLARFKLPRTVDVVTRLPHTVTGKVLKWRLGKDDADAAR